MPHRRSNLANDRRAAHSPRALEVRHVVALAAALSLLPQVALAQPPAAPTPPTKPSAAKADAAKPPAHAKPAADGTAAATSAPSTPRDNSKLVRVRDVLRKAIGHYQRSEFADAKRLLTELLGYVGKDRTREAQEVHTYMAFVLIAFGQTEAAVGAFEKALMIRPDLTLQKTSPKIAAAFESARRRYLAKVRALDHDPPRLRHAPQSSVKHGGGLTVRVETNDVSPIKRVVLLHRVKGNRGFSAVTMERSKPPAGKPLSARARSRWLASIPVLAVVRPGLEYYIEAWDVLGNGPGLKGSAARPIKIQVVGGPLRPGGADVARPFYRKWWFWAIVASAVAAAGAVGVGVYLGREERAGGTVIVPTQPGGR